LTSSTTFDKIPIETIRKGQHLMNSLRDVKTATRQELIAYLESWGTACYDDESTSLLREAAVDTFKTEGC